jgi:threonine synthase
MNKFLLGFRCLVCGEVYPPEHVTYTCPTDGSNLDALYDYASLAREIDPRTITSNANRSIWRYEALLPVAPPSTHHTPLDQLGWSPLYRAPVLERESNVRAVWLKDDSRLPSSSFKDRASAMVIARALETGVKVLCVASTGNAAAALSCLCAGTSLQAVIFVPESTPEGKLASILIHGAKVFMVRGSYNDAVSMAAVACEKFGWYNRSTGVNPYTREGKKTAGFEIAEQLATLTPVLSPNRRGGAFRAPDVVIVPVGDGNIISGVYKGFHDLHQLGWIEKMPRFIGVTAALAPSLYRAWQSGSETFETIPSQTIASGISVDHPCDGVAALRAVRATGGELIEATDNEMLEAMQALATKTGVFAEPASAAACVGLTKSRASGLIRPDDEVVLQLTGSGLKDTRSALRAAGKPTIVESLDDVVL